MNNTTTKKKFALIGSAGFIAPRHMQAIKETGNELVCALDRFDVMGTIDSFSPNADFFTEPERFDRHLDKLRREGKNKIDYVSICSPNYLHDAHIRLALRNQAHAICEKPLVINPWNLDALQEIEKESGKSIYTILQLRLHPAIVALKKQVEQSPPGKIVDIDLTYITSRGRWYFISWKGNLQKSGGLVTNIGIHFFDMLMWVFGEVRQNIVHHSAHDNAAGFLRLERANVRWFLSVDAEDLPDSSKQAGKRTYRSITIEGQEIGFSEGFTGLHTRAYEEILNGKGLGIEDARASINAAYNIRHTIPIGKSGDYHPMLAKI
ncbi:MAG: Gfo/Idh/MocA family oxidoreductase [Bacteroidales bacterium]|nr:Gfo/Idh/MocA family oxidoreductase [Bacteroidales bacterium]MDZ4204335.1 Gfo/Idh/MocA family oxidoreductase [Bacteroidales bacterium]